jgi:hypothetical protein
VAVWDYVQVGGQSACLLTVLTAVSRQCHSRSDTEPPHNSSSGQNIFGFISLAMRPRHLLTLCQDVSPTKSVDCPIDIRALTKQLFCLCVDICIYGSRDALSSGHGEILLAVN